MWHRCNSYVVFHCRGEHAGVVIAVLVLGRQAAIEKAEPQGKVGIVVEVGEKSCSLSCLLGELREIRISCSVPISDFSAIG